MDEMEKVLMEMGKRKDMGELDTEFVDDVEKQRMISLTMKKIEKEREKEEKKGTRRIARWQKNLVRIAAAIAVVITMVVGGTAVAGINLNSMLKNYFDADGTANPAKLKKMLSMSDAKTVSGGVEITVSQIIGDDTGFTAVLRAKNIPNVIEQLTFRDSNISIPANENREIEWASPQILQTSDEYTTILLHVASPSLTGSEIKLSLKDIGYKNEKGTFVPVAKGKWDLNWTLDYTNEAVTTDVNRQITRANGAQGIWKSIVISPLSVTVRYQETKAGKTYVSKEEWEKNEDLERLVVTFKDGTKLDSRFVMNDENGQFDEYDDRTSMGFHKIINPEDVASVTYGKEKFVLDETYQEPKKEVFTSKAAGFTLAMSKELSRIVKTKTQKNYKDMDFGVKASSVEFIGTIKGVKMSLFTIFKVKGGYSDSEMEEKSPFRQYVGYHDGYTYMIQYGEGDDEKQIEYFKGIMNGEVANILPFFEYIK